MIVRILPALITIGLVLNFLGCDVTQPSQSTYLPRPPVTDLPKKITGRDNAPMVCVPAGEFQMSYYQRYQYRKVSDTYGEFDIGLQRKQAHTVYLDAFYMDSHEVTNEQYRMFMDATGRKPPRYWSNDSNQPVVGVNWYDAKAYADWAGKRLPTEAEWEKAARGGLEGKPYPWGDNPETEIVSWRDRGDVGSFRVRPWEHVRIEDAHSYANYYDTGMVDIWEGVAPVCSFSSNGYGLYDMAGNVREWCADWYDENYYSKSPRQNPTGPRSGHLRVLRGGSWNARVLKLRVAYRDFAEPGSVSEDIGFRCVQDIKINGYERTEVSKEEAVATNEIDEANKIAEIEIVIDNYVDGYSRRNADMLMSSISPDYSRDGETYLDLRKRMESVFAEYQRVELRLEKLQIKLTDKGATAKSSYASEYQEIDGESTPITVSGTLIFELSKATGNWRITRIHSQ